TGDYSQTGTSSSGETSHEVNTYTNGNAEFTETISESFDFSESGNVITGSYTRDEINGIHSSSLDATTTDASGTYTVTQSSNGTFTRSESGNTVDGSYT